MKRKSGKIKGTPPGRRRQSRELALQLLYAIEITKYSVEETLEMYQEIELQGKVSVNDFTRSLLTVFSRHRQELDETLQKVITNWRLERVSNIDRNLLRLAAAEIHFFDDIPPKVTINEYIEIAKKQLQQETLNNKLWDHG